MMDRLHRTVTTSLALALLTGCAAPSIFTEAPRRTFAIAPLETGLADIEAVQAEFNRMPYISDVADEWKSPATFLAEGGDCEDYAIAKASALLALGYRREDMRIAVFSRPHRKADHAVLVVRHEGSQLVLDNANRWIYPLGKDVAYTVGF